MLSQIKKKRQKQKKNNEKSDHAKFDVEIRSNISKMGTHFLSQQSNLSCGVSDHSQSNMKERPSSLSYEQHSRSQTLLSQKYNFFFLQEPISKDHTSHRGNFLYNEKEIRTKKKQLMNGLKFVPKRLY